MAHYIHYPNMEVWRFDEDQMEYVKLNGLWKDFPAIPYGDILNRAIAEFLKWAKTYPAIRVEYNWSGAPFMKISGPRDFETNFGLDQLCIELATTGASKRYFSICDTSIAQQGLIKQPV